MDWIVTVSSTERLEASLSSASADAAYAAMNEHGCVVLRGAFTEDAVDAMHRAYLAQYGALDAERMAAQAEAPAPNPVYWVGEGRYDITARMDGVFGDPNVFANPLLRSLLSRLLGDDMCLSGMSVVVSHPGAEMQHIHRDHPLLFADADVSVNLPTYALSVAVPLIDVDAQTGPTGIWLGSNRWPASTTPGLEGMTVLPLQRTDCLLLDYRTLHAGLPNRSNLIRPVAYMVYSRTWFFDEVNHRMRPSLAMTLEQYEALPESVQALVPRTFSLHMRARFFSERSSEIDPASKPGVNRVSGRRRSEPKRG